MDASSASGSSSSASTHHRRRPRHRTTTTAQLAVADRIVRALRHPLLLLHRSESDFFVLGATGNVYTVSITTSPSCTCPDRLTPCKHILFVLIRVLGLSPDDPSLKRTTLRPCHVTLLLSSPALLDSLARPALRERFHQLFFQRSTMSSQQQNQENDKISIEEGTTCPVCLEEIVTLEEERENNNNNNDDDDDDNKVVVRCRTCRNAIHEECLMKWKRSRGRRAASCVICRARWRDIRNSNPDRYLNLAAYNVSSEDDDHNAADQSHGSMTGHSCSGQGT